MSISISDADLFLQQILGSAFLGRSNTWTEVQHIYAIDLAGGYIEMNGNTLYDVGNLLLGDTRDVNISRLDAASLAIGDGTPGDTGGTLTLVELVLNGIPFSQLMNGTNGYVLQAKGDEYGNEIATFYAQTTGTYSSMTVGYASYAGSASSADIASFAYSSSTAASADSATTAGSADYAIRAYYDGDGNSIVGTYAQLGTTATFANIYGISTIENSTNLLVVDCDARWLYDGSGNTIFDFSAQASAIANATTAVDVITQFNSLLATLRTYGLIAT